jgi:hypothetical protein
LSRRLILGIDPGPAESAYCLIDCRCNIAAVGKVPNERILAGLRCAPPAAIAMEWIRPYGRPVGGETFDTCRMEGRIVQEAKRLGVPLHPYGRHKYGKGLLQDTVVNDKLLKQHLVERFGPETMARLTLKDGKSDLRSAFAVAVYHIDVTGGAHA